MTLRELLPAVHALPRGDKLRLMQLIVGDLAQEESLWAGTGDAEHNVWSPHDAFDAAATLLQVLDSDPTALNRTGSRHTIPQSHSVPHQYPSSI